MLGKNLADQRCVATFWIDERGNTTRVAVEGCLDPFALAVMQAGARWRWTPPEVDGEPTSVKTVVPFNFKQSAGRRRPEPRPSSPPPEALAEP